MVPGDEDESDSEASSETGSQPDGEQSPEEPEEDELPDIELGEGVARHHAVIFNEAEQCSLYAASEEGLQQTYVNGKSLKQLFQAQGADDLIYRRTKPKVAGIELSHADTLVFGRHFFVFVDHTISSPEILIASGQVDYGSAKREWQIEQLSGVHESLIVGARGPRGVSHAVELAEKDEVIEAQRVEIVELKGQVAMLMQELERYKKMAGGRLASGANMLGEMYADDLLEGEMDKHLGRVNQTRESL